MFSLSLSLSGAGEPQTFLVWGSPCVSSSWTRSSPSIRTSSSSPSPRRSPAPVFFFLVVVARFRFGVFSFLVLSVLVVWWVYSVLVFVGLLLCLCFLSWPSGAFFFFWVGGVPLAAFSLCFPLGSRVDWGCVLLSSFCCLLHLASLLAPRETWSTDPQPPRPLQPFAFARPASPVSCWESSVGRAEVKGCRVTGGGCDPAHYLGIMIIVVCGFQAGHRTPEIDPGHFVSARVDFGFFLFVFVCNITT